MEKDEAKDTKSNSLRDSHCLPPVAEEIVVKMAGFGCAYFFFGPERCWNCFDLIIISTSVFETVMDRRCFAPALV